MKGSVMVAQALVWLTVALGLVLIAVLSGADLSTQIVLSGGYVLCFTMAALLLVTRTLTRRQRTSPQPRPSFGRTPRLVQILAGAVMYLSVALVAAAIIDLVNGDGSIVFLISALIGLLIVVGLAVTTFRRS